MSDSTATDTTLNDINTSQQSHTNEENDPKRSSSPTSSINSTSTKANESKIQSNLAKPSSISKLAKPTSKLPAPSLSSTSTQSANSLMKRQIDETTNKIDLSVNDRVLVNGTKLGTLAFVGETNFKEGIWAGIILDNAEGKNDGSMNGIRYFTSAPNYGMFCRLDKLTKVQSTPTASSTNGSNGLKVGDRVVINNTSGSDVKIGTLRYFGTTDFAKGEWAGVELDDKLGKNDGSVQDKRYFTCQPMYGVFAPAQKVKLFNEKSIPSANSQTGSSQVNIVGRRSISNITPLTTQSKLTKNTSNNIGASRESLNGSEKSSLYSIGSAAMIAGSDIGKNMSSAQRINSMKTAKASGLNPMTTTKLLNSNFVNKKMNDPSILQQLLREKENHIAQLLKDRDFDRAEFVRGAQKFEETEKELIECQKILNERNTQVIKLEESINELKDNKTDLVSKLDADRTKIEDLEFQIEEHKLGCIDKNDDNNEDDNTKNNSRINPEKSNSPNVAQLSQEDADFKQKLDSQLLLCNSHLEENKQLKEQIDSLNVDLKQMKLGHEVFTQEKEDLKKQNEEKSLKLEEAKAQAAELIELKQKFADLQIELNKNQEETTKNEVTIKSLNDDLKKVKKIKENLTKRNKLSNLFCFLLA
jgi:CAP-Gly domain-containing linker protein 1